MVVGGKGTHEAVEQKCEWDVRVCVDGTWVNRNPDRNCDFDECWVHLKIPPPVALDASQPTKEPGLF